MLKILQFLYKLFMLLRFIVEPHYKYLCYYQTLPESKGLGLTAERNIIVGRLSGHN